MPVGKKVVILGGLIQGCQVAEFLVKRGRKVTIVEESGQFGTGIPEVKRVRLLSWLSSQGVMMLSGISYKKINIGDHEITLVSNNGEKKEIEADNVLVTVPFEPDKELFKALEGRVPEIYMIGDCQSPGLIVDAVAEGSRIGRMI
jgi:2,4-dienoyl-CoA reductase (NADPH2)